MSGVALPWLAGIALAAGCYCSTQASRHLFRKRLQCVAMGFKDGRHGMTRRSAVGRVLGAAGLATTAAAIKAQTGDHASDSRIAAFEGKLLRARPLPLASVRLTGGPLKEAQDADIKYLLELQPDRMLSYYRTVAGLTPKAEPLTGWDGGKRNLTGHIAGHYLSAVSLMFAATG